MPVGGLLWVELISRVTGSERPCSAERDAVSEAADQQDTHTHTHRKQTDTNTDGQVCGQGRLTDT